MQWLAKFTASPTLIFTAIAVATIVSGAAMQKQSESSRVLLKKYLEVLPSISLEMVKAQSALEASDKTVLVPQQVDMLEETLAKLLSSQYSSFEKRRLAMKIEILRTNEEVEKTDYDRELHRFGDRGCEPNVQLVNQIEQLEPLSVRPQYQVTLCYLNRDGTTMMSSASSLDLSPSEALDP
ncbi:hypothetical protein K6Q96_20615 [Grimontia kaedaensis]|uniref:Uncharacterized protein n=1 Tax=Grimontia kaedaensis TaxID=2872157 RepID=A0ABY4X2V0_9GAMM|nr:hypothetical protein [Grimontia kaedaensis]USH05598.1 hypothetical protein K6Q96_20615 [Grimontia kaedaensis]